MINISTLTASEARQDLYNLIRKASRGPRAFEIKLRGVDSVILISKEELEGWLETLDIMSNTEEVKAIEEGKRSKKLIPFEDIKKELGL